MRENICKGYDQQGINFQNIPKIYMAQYQIKKKLNHWTWTGNSFHIWYYSCFNAILPNHPTLSLSHRAHKTVLYISALGYWLRGMVQGGRREEGSGWGTHVHPWQIHVDIWQNQYNIVKLKNKIKKNNKKIKLKNKKTIKKWADINRHFSKEDISSVQFSHSVVSDSSQPHGLQHSRPPCPSPTPRVYSNSCPLSWWCHPTISSSAVPFSSRLQSFPASESFQMSQMAKRQMKRYSTVLIILEMQIKTTVRYHLIPVRRAIIKTLQTINSGEGVEKREPSYSWWECKLV